MKYIFNFILITFFLIPLFSGAQNLNFNEPLPVDQTIKKGVLPNGMTYYIKSTDVIKDAASYYIIQNVGSVLEEDNQQGLAHFLEHMAFNGTESFPGKGILNTLQKYGAVFGRDINAYTSFDETVYNLNNIPTKDGLVDTCLTVLHDWSNNLLLTDEEIDAERGVIKEEWRTRQNGGMRLLNQSLATRFNNTIYAERMPIGLMDIVENFEYKALRDFYHDWYRTDLQAIAIIGDVDVDVIENKIKDLFSSIPAVKNPKERKVISIPGNDDMLYTLATDAEVKTAQMSFTMRHDRSVANQTVADLKESLINSMISNMFSDRIREITAKPDAPFLATQLGYGKNTRTSNNFSLNISPKPNQQHKAFKAALQELNRAVKFGFTNEEISRAILKFKNSYETAISKKADKSHGAIASAIKENYLENITLTDVEKEYELAKVIFNNLNENEVLKRLGELYTKNNRYLIVFGVEGDNNLSKEDAQEIIESVENDNTLKAYSDGFSGKTLISNIDIKEGKITSENINKDINATTFFLSNGIKVHYKFVDKNKNSVSLNAVSEGGLSLIEDADLPSASLVPNLVQSSGLADYTASDLTKVLAGKTASTGVSISGLSENIQGSSVTKDVETMLQSVYLRFVKPRFDQDAFKVLNNNISNYLISKSEDLNAKINDSVLVALYGNNHPTKRMFNSDYVADVSFDKIKEIYLDRFGNAADFEFFIIGDIQADDLKPLLEKYIASIPTNDVKEVWKDNSTNWISNTIDKDVYLKMEDPKSTVKISYENDYGYSLKDFYTARALGDILDLRFTETLREEEGGTYGASASARLSKKPKGKGTISVSFDCNPEKVEQLVAIVHEEVNKIANGNINQDDLDKTITSYLKGREQQQNYNSYEMNVLTNYFREGYNMNDPENFENIVKNISTDDVASFTENMLKGARSYEIVIKPVLN